MLRTFVIGWMLVICQLATCLLLLCGCSEDSAVHPAAGNSAQHPAEQPVGKPFESPGVHGSKPTAVPLSQKGSAFDPPAEENPVAAANERVAAAEGTAAPAQVRAALPVERLADDRPPLDEAGLRASGIHVLRSRRLVLLTDLEPETVKDLPALADQLFDALEAAMGKLPVASDGSEFQVTGCLMAAQERFANARLLPSEDLTIKHGRHFNYRFWMFNPASEYYRRHLLFHEFVHCFMTSTSGMNNIPALWYTEGIAEYFATHHLASPYAATDAAIHFGVLPKSAESFEGWGRISEIRRSFIERPAPEVVPAGFVSLDQVLYPESTIFDQDSQYAHAWAVVWYLHSNPRWQSLQQKLSPLRKRLEFEQAMASLSRSEEQHLAVEWLLFLDSLCEDFDTERAFPDWGHALNLNEENSTSAETVEVSVESSKSWQCVPIAITQGTVLRITATGTATFGKEPRPWIAEPDGITFDYHRGLPLGQLVAMFVAKDGTWASRRIPIGKDATVEFPSDGTLWLQANESNAHRSNNSGNFQVEVHH